jgi:hypothetical protein
VEPWAGGDKNYGFLVHQTLLSTGFRHQLLTKLQFPRFHPSLFLFATNVLE